MKIFIIEGNKEAHAGLVSSIYITSQRKTYLHICIKTGKNVREKNKSTKVYVYKSK